MGSVQRAYVEDKIAYLSGDFGRDYAMKVFGLSAGEIEAIVGRYAKGKRKGELRGAVAWKKCLEGGWHRESAKSGGRVVRPNSRWDFKIVDPNKRGADGDMLVLWSETHKRFGWVPGETREQYDTRTRQEADKRKAHREYLAGQAKSTILRLTQEEAMQRFHKRLDRGDPSISAAIITQMLIKRIANRLEA
jgi:hypothetical protein